MRKSAQGFWWSNVEEKGNVEDPDVDGWIIQK
jgi:hypothetical protein